MPDRSDHPSGLEQLFADLRPELLRFLAARLGDPVEAEDVLQDLWLRIADVSLGPVAHGRAYIYRCGENLCRDRGRERARRSARDADWMSMLGIVAAGGEPIDPSSDASTVLIERTQDELLERAIHELPERAGRVLQLHKYDGMSHREIAGLLGISVSGVEKHMATAMTHLRRAMARPIWTRAPAGVPADEASATRRSGAAVKP